jgi:hypothetical protein
MRSDHVLKLLLNIRIHPSFPIHVRNEKYIEFYSPEYIKYLVKCKNGLLAKEFEGIVRRCMGSKRRIEDDGGRRLKVKAVDESDVAVTKLTKVGSGKSVQAKEAKSGDSKTVDAGKVKQKDK